VTVAIVDTGVANFGSIENAVVRAGGSAHVARTREDIERASHIVLPGVGSFDVALRTIEERGLREVLTRMATQDGVPTLGICLGMQLLGRSSEEGKLAGLGWLSGRTVKLSSNELKVPHIGWNAVNWSVGNDMLEAIDPGSRFYFVHSYHYQTNSADEVVAHVDYGGRVAAVVRRGNIIGTQFHPEKSRVGGLRLLRNFLQMSN
jgi:glutamine amidotransferase